MIPAPIGDPLSDLHLEWLTNERNVSPATVKARRTVLRSIGCAGTADRATVEAWWDTRRDLSRNTRNADLTHLRTFYRWCRIWEHRQDDPSLRLTGPRKEKGLPRPVSRAELHTILDAMPPDLRRAVALGAYAGLRVSEAAALVWTDIDRETNRLRVTGKGLKTRLVGLSPLLLDEMLPDTGGNVVTAGAQPYSADSLQRRVNRAIQRAGVQTTFHALRHRFGTVALAGTGDLLAVSRAMGHASPATTAIYAASGDETLDQIAQAVTR